MVTVVVPEVKAGFVGKEAETELIPRPLTTLTPSKPVCVGLKTPAWSESELKSTFRIVVAAEAVVMSVRDKIALTQYRSRI